jgi:uncharacterized protein (DUF433 family)
MEEEMSNTIIIVDTQIMSGTPVFAGTRVPASILIDWLTEGETIESFLRNYPTVKREQAVAFLRESLEAVLPHASAA